MVQGALFSAAADVALRVGPHAHRPCSCAAAHVLGPTRSEASRRAGPRRAATCSTSQSARSLGVQLVAASSRAATPLPFRIKNLGDVGQPTQRIEVEDNRRPSGAKAHSRAAFYARDILPFTAKGEGDLPRPSLANAETSDVSTGLARKMQVSQEALDSMSPPFKRAVIRAKLALEQDDIKTTRRPVEPSRRRGTRSARPRSSTPAGVRAAKKSGPVASPSSAATGEADIDERALVQEFATADEYDVAVSPASDANRVINKQDLQRSALRRAAVLEATAGKTSSSPAASSDNINLQHSIDASRRCRRARRPLPCVRRDGISDDGVAVCAADAAVAAQQSDRRRDESGCLQPRG